MNTDNSAYFPIGLVLGMVLGALFGNPAVGGLLGMVTGLIISTSSRKQRS